MGQWQPFFPAEKQRIAQLLIERVQLHEDGLDIVWRETGWHSLGLDMMPLVGEMRRAEIEQGEAL